MCRLCAGAVESPEHALLMCTGRQDLVAARTVFYGKLQRLLPPFVPPATPEGALPALWLLLDSQASAAEMAGYIRSVFTICTSVELVWPVEFVERVP